MNVFRLVLNIIFHLFNLQNTQFFIFSFFFLRMQINRDDEDKSISDMPTNPDFSVKINIKQEIDNIIEEITKEGVEEYFRKLKDESFALPSRDLVVKDLNYSVKVSKKSKYQEVSNFVKDFISIIGSPFSRNSNTKEILKNINLNLKSGTTTIVWNALSL